MTDLKNIIEISFPDGVSVFYYMCYCVLFFSFFSLLFLFLFLVGVGRPSSGMQSKY